jgi:hypothetical protein
MENNVVIVAESKTEKEIGQTLKNLIGKMGKYKAVLWDTKNYRNNEPTFSSSQKIIFIGGNEFSTRNFSSVEWKYEKFNMRYGWVGAVAVIHVLDKKLSKEELAIFKKLRSEQRTEMEKLSKSNVAGTIAIAAGLAITGGLILLSIGAIVKLIVDNASAKTKLQKEQYSYLATDFFVKNLDSFMGESQ